MPTLQLENKTKIPKPEHVPPEKTVNMVHSTPQRKGARTFRETQKYTVFSLPLKSALSLKKFLMTCFKIEMLCCAGRIIFETRGSQGKVP
jgi:hypothetical protein